MSGISVSACKGSTGSQKSSILPSSLPDADPEARRERGAILGYTWDRAGLGARSQCLQGPPREQCGLLLGTLRADCRENRALCTGPEALGRPACFQRVTLLCAKGRC